MQISPSVNLYPFIKHYLFLDSNEKRVKNLRLFSDGNTGIVFSLKSNLRMAIRNGNTDQLPSSFVYGQLTNFRDLYLAGEESLVIIVFQPSGLYKMIQIPGDELLDNIIRTEDLFGNQSLILREKLFEQSDVRQKVDLLNKFFTMCSSRIISSADTLIGASLSVIIQNHGLISMSQLVKHTGYTERHLERKFNESIGLSPKRFGSIIRLHHFLRILKTCTGDLTQMGYDAGYFDQSHLIREFKKYTGMTPKRYVTASDKLTINFVEL